MGVTAAGPVPIVKAAVADLGVNGAIAGHASREDNVLLVREVFRTATGEMIAAHVAVAQAVRAVVDRVALPTEAHNASKSSCLIST